jgi:polysaccharide export outer membrane protein
MTNQRTPIRPSLYSVLAGLVALIGLAVAGCGITPSTGPLSREIGGDPGKTDASEYVVIDVNHDVIRAIGAAHRGGLSRLIRTAAAAPKARIGAGDILAVTVYEAGEGGLFTGKEQRHASFPAVQVDQQGNISLPYAGLMTVQNRTPLEVQKLIVERLQGRAIQPQVVVSIASTESNTFVLAGDVTNPGRYALSTTGDRLLDVVAKAGGSRFPAREVYVTFVRGQQRGTQLLERIIDEQNENIFILAGDRIYINHDPKRYSVFGAVQKPGAYVFPASQVNLLEAMAIAGGLIDERADSTGIFVFRYEPEAVVRAILPDAKHVSGSGSVPTVYRISLRDPGSYFYARGFLVRDKDVLYIANAPGVEIAKVLRLMDLGTRSFGNLSGNVRAFD